MEATLYAPGNRVPAWLAYRHTVRSFRRQFRALRTPMDEIWRSGTAPILCVHGEQDRLVPVSTAHALREKFPDQVRLAVIPNAGHALLPEQPETVFRAILSFFQEHSLGPDRVSED
jgi:pimeloyl-ACP methyl ester carboxylesterase